MFEPQLLEELQAAINKGSRYMNPPKVVLMKLSDEDLMDLYVEDAQLVDRALEELAKDLDEQNLPTV